MSQQIPFNKIHIFDQYFKKRKQKKLRSPMKFTFTESSNILRFQISFQLHVLWQK